MHGVEKILPFQWALFKHFIVQKHDNRIRYKFFNLEHLLLYINNIQIQRAYNKMLLVTSTTNCFSYVNCAALSKHDIDIRFNVLTKHGTLFDLRLNVLTKHGTHFDLRLNVLAKHGTIFDLRLNGDLYIHPSKSVVIPLGGILLDSIVA